MRERWHRSRSDGVCSNYVRPVCLRPGGPPVLTLRAGSYVSRLCTCLCLPGLPRAILAEAHCRPSQGQVSQVVPQAARPTTLMRSTNDVRAATLRQLVHLTLLALTGASYCTCPRNYPRCEWSIWSQDYYCYNTADASLPCSGAKTTCTHAFGDADGCRDKPADFDIRAGSFLKASDSAGVCILNRDQSLCACNRLDESATAPVCDVCSVCVCMYICMYV